MRALQVSRVKLVEEGTAHHQVANNQGHVCRNKVVEGRGERNRDRERGRDGGASITCLINPISIEQMP